MQAEEQALNIAELNTRNTLRYAESIAGTPHAGAMVLTGTVALDVVADRKCDHNRTDWNK